MTGSGKVALAVAVVVGLFVVFVGLDWVASTHVGTATATVESIGTMSGSRFRKHELVVNLGGRVTVRASNPSRIAGRKGDHAELDVWETPFLGLRQYVVRAVVHPTTEDVRPPSGHGSPNGERPSGAELMIVGAAALLLSLASMVHLWLGRQASLARKLGWSVILLVPLFGPGFYFVLFERLRGQPAHLRANRNEFIQGGGVSHDL